jgi:PBP1b-binding outer membrane lipoprotein LpoB
MKKYIAFLLAGVLFLAGCLSSKNLSEEEKEKYRKARIRYEAGQRP